MLVPQFRSAELAMLHPIERIVKRIRSANGVAGL